MEESTHSQGILSLRQQTDDKCQITLHNVISFTALDWIGRGVIAYMKIIIVGCGKVGEKLAAVLSQEKNDVMIIDKDERVVDELCNKYDIMGTVGNGASHMVQLEAEIESTDLLIATTGSDELNLLCCLTAKKAGRKTQTICRLRNPEYSQQDSFLKEELALAMVINQEWTAAREIARVLKFPSAIEINSFAKGKAETLRFRIPEGSILHNLNLMEVHAKLRCSILVCTVERGGEVIIPKGEFVLQAGDVISVVSDIKSEEKFFRAIGIQTNRVRNAIIVGGGDIGYYLAKQLIASDIPVKIIDKKLERCEMLSEKLPKAEVICGDGSDQELLQEEGLDSTEGFVALTNLDEANIIVSLYARRSGVRKIVTKINRIGFEDVINSLDLDTTIHPRNLTAEYILQYVRAMRNTIGSNVETMHWIVDDKAEALEFLIKDNFRKEGTAIKDMGIKKTVLVACIVRKGKVILPGGNDTLRRGDTAIVVTTERGLGDINDIFEERYRPGLGR